MLVLFFLSHFLELHLPFSLAGSQWEWSDGPYSHTAGSCMGGLTASAPSLSAQLNIEKEPTTSRISLCTRAAQSDRTLRDPGARECQGYEG